MIKIENINKYEELINEVCLGDCAQIMTLLPNSSIDLIVSDPPYGMEFRSNYRKEKHIKIENDNNLDWLPAVAKELFRVLADDSHCYLFCSFHNVDIFKQELQKHFKLKNILIWYKNNTGMGDLDGDYAPQYEFILYLTKGNRKLNNGRSSNIIHSKKTFNNLHPTEKPVDLITFLINKSSNRDDVVFDPFMGSWTTARACKDLGRNFIGCELEEKYCDIGEQRLRQQNLF